MVIDLSGAGFLMTSARDGVSFDFSHAGKRSSVAWTQANSQVGFLALPNEHGIVGHGAELFSSLSPQAGVSGDRSGFKALAAFDKPSEGGNGDGQLTSADAIWPKLRIWVDKNHDGISQLSELLTLTQAGVQSIGLSYSQSRWRDAHGNLFRFRSQIVWNKPINGKTSTAIYDVVLQHQSGDQ
ncbi:MAG: hypothetical protein WDO73_32770 [Ignavibacteriota bacterium]